MHILHVLEAVKNIQLEILKLSNLLSNERAITHLNFGAARRTRMIWGGFRQLSNLIPPDRSEPMTHDDVFEAARALNDIYIHSRGTLDNYGWTLINLFCNEDSFRRNEVDLFGRRFQSEPSLKEFYESLAPYLDWNREIKERRDPVAHRIPLSVPPSLFTDDDQVRFSDLNDRYNAAIIRFAELASAQAAQHERETAEAEADRLYLEMQRIGRFSPIIVHDPKEGGTRIYPTVPQDIGKLVQIIRTLNKGIYSTLMR